VKRTAMSTREPTSRGFGACEGPDAEAGGCSEDAGVDSDIAKKELPGSSTAVRAEVRIGRSQKNSGGRCCGSFGRSIREQGAIWANGGGGSRPQA